MQPAAGGDQQQANGPDLFTRILNTAAAGVDDVVLIALKSIQQRHPDWFGAAASEAGHLAKAFNPDQPRDSDGRWKHAGVVAGAAAAGGIAAGVGAEIAIRRVGDRAFDDVRASMQPLRAARALHRARLARHAAAVTSIERGLRSPSKFLGPAIRSFSSRIRRTENSLRHAEVARFLQSMRDDEDVPPSAGEVRQQRNLAFMRTWREMLQEKGKPPFRGPVKARKNRAQVPEYDTTYRGAHEIRWKSEGTPASLLESKKADWAKRGVTTVKELERWVVNATPKERKSVFEAYGTRPPRIVRPVGETTARNVDRDIGAHRRRYQGFPKDDERKELREDALADIEPRVQRWRGSEYLRAGAHIADAESAARVAAAPGLRTLAMLGTRNRYAAIGAAALAGAGAAGAVAHWLNRRGELSKAADDTPEPDPEAVYNAGADVEKSLASRIADTFNRWINLPTRVLTTVAPALRNVIAGSFERAMAPLDGAATEAAAVEVPVVTQDGGQNRIVSTSLDTGSPWVKRYSEDYRVKLAGQIADEQMQNVQAILQDATAQGAAPATTARLIREQIGLTPYQAGFVRSYRLALEALDPNALNRALRDARYDRTVSKAIQTGTKLDPEQVDAMVSAYHRRALALRATTIARTEGLRAANNGHAVAIASFLNEHPDYTVVKTWMATHDERTRPDHVALDGQQVVGLYTPFVAPSGDSIMWPHQQDAPLRQQINCFMPGTMIEGRILRATRAEYRGPMREIITRSGARLTVTIKHPILTSQGFRAAGVLRHGDKVLSNSDNVEGTLAISANQNNGPARIEDIFDAFRAGGRATVKLEAEDLYGDALFCQRDVEIVSSNRELLLDLQSLVVQRDGQIILEDPSVRHALMSRDRAEFPALHGLGASARAFPGAANLSFNASAVGLHLGPFCQLSFGLPSQRNAVALEASAQAPAGNAGFIREGLQGDSIAVALNQFVNVRDLNSIKGINRNGVAKAAPSSCHIGRAAESDTSLYEMPGEGALCASLLFREILHRDAGLVSLDEIVEVRDFEYHGPVFDVESTSGWVMADGIIGSNCRCAFSVALVQRTGLAQRGFGLVADSPPQMMYEGAE